MSPRLAAERPAPEIAAQEATQLQRLGVSAAEELRATVRTALGGLFGKFLQQLPVALNQNARNLAGTGHESILLDLARAVPASNERWMSAFLQQVDQHLVGGIVAKESDDSESPSMDEAFALANIELEAEEQHQALISELDKQVDLVRQTIYIPINTKALAPAGLCRALQDTADALGWPNSQRRVLFEKFDDIVFSELQRLYRSLLDSLTHINVLAAKAAAEARAAQVAPTPMPAPAPAPVIEAPVARAPVPPPVPAPAPAAPAAAPVARPVPPPAMAPRPAARPAAPLPQVPRPAAHPAPASVAVPEVVPALGPLPTSQGTALKVDTQTVSMLQAFAVNDAGTVYSDGSLASELLAISQHLPVPDVSPKQEAVPLQRMTLAGQFLNDAISDPLVPEEFRSQHESVRFPLVKSALADETFFTAVTHPLRSLVNELMLKSATTRITGSAETRRLADLLQQVLVQFDLAPSFVREAMLTSKPIPENQIKLFFERQRQEAQMRRDSILADARRRVITELERATFGVSLPAPAAQFLNKAWGPLLLKRLLRHGVDHADWKSALSAMDELLTQLDNRKPEDTPGQPWLELMQSIGQALTAEGVAAARVSQELAALEAARRSPVVAGLV